MRFTGVFGVAGLAVALAGTVGCKDKPACPPSVFTSHVIEIDIDDHGLAGLWMANAPNLKGLIAQGTFGYTRVIVPTHSNQSNIALLSGQYPDGNNVPGNNWLSRPGGFTSPISVSGLSVGDYARYDVNPLLTRGDSAYRAASRAGGGTAYVGELPPFEAGADQVHLSIVGAQFGALPVTPVFAQTLLTSVLGYPASVVGRYKFDGPPNAGETLAHFTMRDAAQFIRSTSASNPMPAFMFVWTLVALDDDPTSATGASGPDLIRLVEDYDNGVGDILAALGEKGLRESTNILFTLDHGKVDTHRQVVMGTRGGGGAANMPADGQLAALVASRGPALGLSTSDYAFLNEDGDGQIYARVPGAGTEAGAARQAEVTHALVTLVQSGEIMGLDTTRTMTADGFLGTRRFHDFRGTCPNQADIVVYPQDDWTLNQVDPGNTQPGPFVDHAAAPFGRHGGFSVDELYVPLIMSGPAFKRGVILPHPVEHPQVPVTALATLGDVRLTTASVPAISAALVGNPGETVPSDDNLPTVRERILQASGFGGPVALAGAPAASAVLIDVAGLYDEELFTDETLADAAMPLRELAMRGVRFQDFWTRSRDWPVTEFEMLVGGYPAVTPWIASAEDDPALTLSPAGGFLKMPTVPGFIAHRGGYDRWRQAETTPWAGQTLFDAAHALGMTTALVGSPDFHDLHIDHAPLDMQVPATLSDVATAVTTVLSAQAKTLAVVALGGARPADRHSTEAQAGLGTIANAVAAAAAAAVGAGALVIVTSRGATVIDDPGADSYGAGSSRHVPFIVVGPNVRSGITTSQHGAPSDIPATILFGLGAITRSDFVDGTWAAGTPVGGIPQPSPSTATGGHALVRAFTLAP